jgi:hypothetical protein
MKKLLWILALVPQICFAAGQTNITEAIGVVMVDTNGAVIAPTNMIIGVIGTNELSLGRPVNRSGHKGMGLWNDGSKSVIESVWHGHAWMPIQLMGSNFRFVTGQSTNAFVVNDDGNIGLGNPSPSFTVDVGNGTGIKTLRVNGGTNTAEGAAFYVDGSIGMGTYSAITGSGTNHYGLIQGYNQPVIIRVNYSDILFVTLNGRVGVKTDSPSDTLSVNGSITATSLYATNDISALSFTDRSDAPADLEEAYRIVQSHFSVDGHIDHSQLDASAWGKRPMASSVASETTQPIKGGFPAGIGIQPLGIEQPSETIEYEPDQSRRNLSMVVSAQALVIKDLISRIEKLESK